MSLKDWFLSKSYRQATIKHAKNATPYLKETAVAAGVVVGVSAIMNLKHIAYTYIFNHQTDNDNLTYKIFTKICRQKQDSYTYKQYNNRIISTCFHVTADRVLKPIAASAVLNTGVQILKVTYCDDKGLSVEGVSTGLSNSWKQACDAAYGAKEIGYCALNAFGYAATFIGVDVIYDNFVVPCAGDVLHIH